ncbi:hypothetical protein JCM16138_18930 [Thermococcus atlanticus]
MKIEGFVASLRNAGTIEELFNILSSPIVDLDDEKFLVVIEGDFEGSRFFTEINGEKANSALGDAMLNSSSFPFRCKRPYTGGNAIFVKFEDIESGEFLIAYKNGKAGRYFHVKEGSVREITEEEYRDLIEKMPEFKVRAFSEEQMDMMGAFFG